MKGKEKTTKKLGELLPAKLQSTSIAGTLSRVHAKILHAKSADNTELTAKELDAYALIFCAQSGIKSLPSTVIIDVCLASWQDKFSEQMTKHEMYLAFEMNVNGDYNVKAGTETLSRINHYQCFSVEFFCDVLNQYLKERVSFNKKMEQEKERQKEEATKKLPAPDLTVQLFEMLLTDYKKYHTEQVDLFSPDNNFETHIGFTTAAKLELVNELYNISLDEDNIAKLREHAKRIVIRMLHNKKRGYDKRKLFGVVVSIEHQVSRLKTGKLLNIEDESMIQQQVTRLLYMQVLAVLMPAPNQNIDDTEFVKCVRENIELYKQSKK